MRVLCAKRNRSCASLGPSARSDRVRGGTRRRTRGTRSDARARVSCIGEDRRGSHGGCHAVEWEPRDSLVVERGERLHPNRRGPGGNESHASTPPKAGMGWITCRIRTGRSWTTRHTPRTRKGTDRSSQVGHQARPFQKKKKKAKVPLQRRSHFVTDFLQPSTPTMPAPKPGKGPVSTPPCILVHASASV